MLFPPEPLNRDHFDERTANGIVLVDFWAAWCPPCRQQLEILDRMTADRTLPDGVVFYKVNVDEERTLASFYHVETIPTWIAFRNGSLIFRQSGVMQPGEIRQLAAYCRKNVWQRLWLRLTGKSPRR
ncbi:MAG: thioredoxin family protein [Lentisphaeria bacterium]|nr:thioredoxin family protein [Lentisphaeria bacterium]